MGYRRRIYFTEKQKAEIWDRWQRGESMRSIGRLFDRGSSSIYPLLARTGGIRPPERRRSRLALTLAEREEVSRSLGAGLSLRSIARQLRRAPSTISREVQRNGGQLVYRATSADEAAWGRARRPKPCKLANQPALCQTIAEKLVRKWSPQQIAGWLKREHPDDEGARVSHETIYRSLFIQARGVLKKELLVHLRSTRAIRRSRHASLKRDGLGQIKDAISIRERPATVEDRAIPGHWEGDLIAGSKNSFIATLVERRTRYVMLANPRASLRSVLCVASVFKAWYACRLSMQMTGTSSSASPWYSIGAMRPVSKTTRLQAGAPSRAADIASGVEAALVSNTTVPLQSRTQMCVFSSDTSRPAK
jgi:DNA-binding CsgD family transcriptional regulator